MIFFARNRRTVSADLTQDVDHPRRGILGGGDLARLRGGVGTDGEFEALAVDPDVNFVIVHSMLLINEDFM